MKKFVPGSTNAWALGALIIPVEVMYTFSHSHINVNLPFIQDDLHLDTVEVMWVQYVEMLITIVLATMAGKLGEKFGVPLIFTVGVFIFSLANISFAIPGISDNWYLVLGTRCIASIGQGLMQPSLMPLGIQLVARQNLGLIITLVAATAPVGSILGSFIAGTVAFNWGWQYMCVICGFIGLLDLVFILMLLPFKSNLVERKTKIDFLGSGLISGSLLSFILGMVSFGGSFLTFYEGGLLIVLFVVLMLLFFVYNFKYSKKPIFCKEVFSTSFIRIYISNLLIASSGTMDKFVEPYQLMAFQTFEKSTVSMIMSVSFLSSFFVGFLVTKMQQKMWLYKCVLIFQFVMFCITILNGFQLMWFQTGIITIIELVIHSGCQIGCLVLGNQMLFNSAPKQLAPQIAVINNIITNLQAMIAYAIASNIQKAIAAPEAFTYPSFATVIFISAALIATAMILIQQIGIFDFEREKRNNPDKQEHKIAAH